MTEELKKLIDERAADSKNPKRYVEIALALHSLMASRNPEEEYADEEFIEEMGWN